MNFRLMTLAVSDRDREQREAEEVLSWSNTNLSFVIIWTSRFSETFLVLYRKNEYLKNSNQWYVYPVRDTHH